MAPLSHLNCWTQIFLVVVAILFGVNSANDASQSHDSCSIFNNTIYWRSPDFSTLPTKETSNKLISPSLLEINLRLERLEYLVQDSLAVSHNTNGGHYRSILNEHFGTLSHELRSLRDFSGASHACNLAERKMKVRIYRDIHKRQQPANCAMVKKLLCKVSILVGFASTIHHLLWCFVIAHYNNLTVIVDFREYLYFGVTKDRVSWEQAFKPLTSCQHSDSAGYYHAVEHDLYSPNNGIHRQALMNIPAKYVDIRTFTSNVLPWWHAQIVGYIMRPSKALHSWIRQAKDTLLLGPKSTVVGLHIRRTDKLHSEARFHANSEYMKHVIAFYDKKEMVSGPIENKLVFVATDDESAVGDLRHHYPEYQFVAQDGSAEFASLWAKRNSIDALYTLLIDTYLLAHSDYLVCTFSSGFSRLAYELGLYSNAKSTFAVQSLDVPFHYDYAFNPPRVALYHSVASKLHDGEWEMKPGDMFYERESESGNDWKIQARTPKVYDGQFMASDFNQSDYGKVDWFKTREKIAVRFECGDN